MKRIIENSGYSLNEQALVHIHKNAKAYDSLVNDQHYMMITEFTADRACVVQFVTEQGKVMTTYTFFKAVISEESKKRNHLSSESAVGLFSKHNNFLQFLFSNYGVMIWRYC